MPTKTNGTKPAAATSAPQASNQKTEPEQPDLAVIDLNHVQEHAIDLAVDLIIHGGARADVRNLVYSLTAHWYRLRFVDYFKDQDDFKNSVASFTNRLLPEWESAIQAGKLQNPRPNLEDRNPEETNLDNVASGLTRAHARRELMGEFEEFLLEGSPEEIALLRDILASRDALFPDRSVAIAEGFSYEIGRRTDYVKVRPDLTSQVKAYIVALEAIPLKAKVA